MSSPAPQGTDHSHALFIADLAAGAYAAGADRGWWHTGPVTWPFAVIELALPPRPGSDDWLALRFQLEGYPEAPTAQPWDAAAGGPLALARWPGGNARITMAFNPGWRQDALYIPMDREALAGHPDWRTKYACHVWDASKDISQYLRLVRSLLNDEGYTGARGG